MSTSSPVLRFGNLSWAARLALALWLLGDPRNDEDHERVATAHDAYHPDQLAAAAAALRPST